MSAKLRYRHRYLALAALALAAAAVPSTALASTPVQDPVPISPNVPFIGLVNGKSSDAVITMVCPGPISQGEQGHPLGGQTVEVETALTGSSLLGNTGSKGTKIDADFNVASASNIDPPLVFTSFFVKQTIPTTDTFPCSGSGAVTFVPLPTSATARDYTVAVTFGNITN